ncbi:hypothetical protein [Telmatospirillum sp.]|uniref:hypothetical protein n=1 Tax=Telmatospirillum sp. TaxID=2079197 RepID=UPI0028429E15|nr:hypothetical protein [Telmatospirillum sp.]MDR3436038.1 hypothetical protein [Telmatospirillum sp.]
MTEMINTFPVTGTDWKFHVLSATVLQTDQRSDTHIRGGGGTVVIDGTGGGMTKIISHVEIVRDIWLRTNDGNDHHIRINKDVPLRAGHRILYFALEGRHLYEKDKKIDKIHYAIYDENVNKIWNLHDDDYIRYNNFCINFMGALSLPFGFMAKTYGATWIVLLAIWGFFRIRRSFKNTNTMNMIEKTMHSIIQKLDNTQHIYLYNSNINDA